MRMRRKRNLEPRLEACSDILAARGVPMKDLKKAAEEYRALFDYEELFGNRNPVKLEIGCGNGGFVSEAARREPGVNFLAVEIISNVIVTAMERIKKENVKNVRFLNIPAEVLPCFVPGKSVECIYLNFSTPLPGSTHARQRLTSPRFLAIYRGLLKDGGTIVQNPFERLCGGGRHARPSQQRRRQGQHRHRIRTAVRRAGEAHLPTHRPARS